MVVIRQMASQEGHAQRALRHASRPAPRPNQGRGVIRPVNALGDVNLECSDSSHTWTTDPPPKIAKRSAEMNPNEVVDAAMELYHILVTTNPDLREATREMIAPERNVMQETKDPPVLTESQIAEAQSVIPNDYWQLNCWSCREAGHSTFTCPMLTPSQRIFFAYKYYLHQIEANPMLKGWYRQKREAMRQVGPDPGPRPPQPDRGQQSRFRGGGGGGYGRGGVRQGQPRPQYQHAVTEQPQEPGTVHVMQTPGDATPPTAAPSEN